MKRIFFAIGLLLWTLFRGCAPAFAMGTIPEERAVRAILGEARGEGEIGMYAVACAIANRGTLRGVYGERAAMPDVTPKLVATARKTWKKATGGGADITHGANHWENVKAFGKPRWADGMVHTVTIGHHSFYRDSHE